MHVSVHFAGIGHQMHMHALGLVAVFVARVCRVGGCAEAP